MVNPTKCSHMSDRQIDWFSREARKKGLFVVVSSAAQRRLARSRHRIIAASIQASVRGLHINKEVDESGPPVAPALMEAHRQSAASRVVAQLAC